MPPIAGSITKKNKHKRSVHTEMFQNPFICARKVFITPLNFTLPLR